MVGTEHGVSADGSIAGTFQWRVDVHSKPTHTGARDCKETPGMIRCQPVGFQLRPCKICLL